MSQRVARNARPKTGSAISGSSLLPRSRMSPRSCGLCAKCQTPAPPVSRPSIGVGLNARTLMRGDRLNLTREEPRQGRSSSRYVAISMHRVPTLDLGSARIPTALQHQGMGHKHCCSEIARLPPSRPSFACGGSRRQPLSARSMQQPAELPAR